MGRIPLAWKSYHPHWHLTVIIHLVANLNRSKFLHINWRVALFSLLFATISADVHGVKLAKPAFPGADGFTTPAIGLESALMIYCFFPFLTFSLCAFTFLAFVFLPESVFLSQKTSLRCTRSRVLLRGGMQPLAGHSSEFFTQPREENEHDSDDLPDVSVEPCGGGGYCGYRSCAFLLLDDKTRYKEVIHAILAFLEKFPVFFKYFSNEFDVFDELGYQLSPTTAKKQSGKGQEVYKPTLEKYCSDMRKFVSKGIPLPPYLHLNNMGIQAMTHIFQVNVITLGPVLLRQRNSSMFFFPNSVQTKSIALKNVKNMHWEALVPSSNNANQIYPLSSEILQNHVPNADFHSSQDLSYFNHLCSIASEIRPESRKFFHLYLKCMQTEPQTDLVTSNTATDLKCYELYFDSKNFFSMKKKQCPYPNCPGKQKKYFKSFSSLKSHWISQKCNLGKHYYVWKKSQNLASIGLSTNQSKVDLNNLPSTAIHELSTHSQNSHPSVHKVPNLFGRCNSPDPIASDVSHTGEMISKPNTVCPSPVPSHTSDISNLSYISSTQSIPLQYQQCITIKFPDGSIVFDPSCTKCKCGRSGLKRISQHWRQASTNSKCELSKIFKEYVMKLNIKFSSVPQFICSKTKKVTSAEAETLCENLSKCPEHQIDHGSVNNLPSISSLENDVTCNTSTHLQDSNSENFQRSDSMHCGRKQKRKRRSRILHCNVCFKIVTNQKNHKLSSPSCFAIDKGLCSESISDPKVRDYVDLHKAVHEELRVAPHAFSEVKDPLLVKMCIDQDVLGTKLKIGQKMTKKNHEAFQNHKKSANDMILPGFPWHPSCKADEDKIHKLFTSWQADLYNIDYVCCEDCNLTKLRTSLEGLDVCPNCESRKKGSAKDEELLEFLKNFKYPEGLEKLSAAEVSVLAIYQAAVSVTYSQKEGLRYRLMRLVLTKQPDEILKTISHELPRQTVNDEVYVLRNAEDTICIMRINGRRVQAWMKWLRKNHSLYKELIDSGKLVFDESFLDTDDVSIEQTNIKSKLPSNCDHTGDTSEQAVIPDPKSEGLDCDESDAESIHAGDFDSDEYEGEDEVLPHPELSSHIPVETYSIDCTTDRLYQRKNRLTIQGDSLKIEDKSLREPVRNFDKVDFSGVFPHLYPYGGKSPFDNQWSHTTIRKRLASLLHFCIPNLNKSSDDLESEKWFLFEEDPIHTSLVLGHAQNQEARGRVRWFLQKNPETTRADIDEVFETLMQGPKGDNCFDTSKLLNIRHYLSQMKHTPQRWQQERKNLESVACDSGDANLFATFNMNVRHWPDVHNMLHLLIHGIRMTNECYANCEGHEIFHDGQTCFVSKYLSDQKTFDCIVNKYAAKIEEFLFFRMNGFLNIWLHEVCGIPTKEGDWEECLFKNNGGYFWRRVEYTMTRGIQHWHMVIKLPGVLHLQSLARIMNRGRQAKVELQRKNILNKKLEMKALRLVKLGLLAEKYLKEYADSLVHMDFLKSAVGNISQKDDVYNLHSMRKEFDQVVKTCRVSSAQDVKVPLTPSNLPLLSFYKHGTNDMYERMAQVAAFTCIHNCIESACGGKTNGKGCRFGYPRKILPVTVLGTVFASKDYTETHYYHKRSCNRTSYTNKFCLLYWGGNHDLQPLLNFSQANRYVTKYVTKQNHETALYFVLEQLLADQNSMSQLSREDTLMRCFSVANMYRSDLTRHQLMYMALNLPEYLYNFGIKSLSINSSMTVKTDTRNGVEQVIDVCENTLYRAYAERPNEMKDMTLYDFATKNSRCAWVDALGKIVPKSVLKRHSNPGQKWRLTFMHNNKHHLRISNLVECPPPHFYKQACNKNKSWDDLTKDEKNMLYRAHQELVLFVPWHGSPDKTFFSPHLYKKLNSLTTEASGQRKERLEAFFAVYLKETKNKRPGSSWHRQNQFLYSMYLASKINKKVRANRSVNDGVFQPELVPGNDESCLGPVECVYEFLGDDETQFDIPECGVDYRLGNALQQLSPPTPDEVLPLTLLFPIKDLKYCTSLAWPDRVSPWWLR